MFRFPCVTKVRHTGSSSWMGPVGLAFACTAALACADTRRPSGGGNNAGPGNVDSGAAGSNPSSGTGTGDGGPRVSNPADAGTGLGNPGPGSDSGPGEGSDAGPVGPSGPGACGLPSAAFCDTFDAPAGNGNRSGQMNGTVWGSSRWTGNENIGSSANDWAMAQLSTCGSTALVNPPSDLQICNGQLVDTVNDGGTVVSLAMYPKQPFDFAGRTGTIVFDVSNDSQGSHAAWPELWIADQPVADPFTHEGSDNLPRNGFGIRFAGCTNNVCADGKAEVGVDSAIMVNNYVGNDSFFQGTLEVDSLGVVLQSMQPGQLNHYEVQVSQNQIDVYATNAFTGPLNLTNTPLVHIATIPNANLNFSRGFIYIEDVHYNADKFNTQRLHSFTWDNVGFDGPILPRDLAFDVPDNDVPDNSAQAGPGVPATDLGYFDGSTSLDLTVPGVTGIASASGVLLTFDIFSPTARTTLDVAVNGNAISVPVNSNTLAVQVPLSAVLTGNNTLSFPSGINVMNVDLIMQGAGGIVSPNG
jgi:hypothetical protein